MICKSKSKLEVLPFLVFNKSRILIKLRYDKSSTKVMYIIICNKGSMYLNSELLIALFKKLSISKNNLQFNKNSKHTNKTIKTII